MSHNRHPAASRRPARIIYTGIDGNVGDHDHLPRRVAASLIGTKRSCAVYRRHLRHRGHRPDNQSQDRHLPRRETEWLGPSLFSRHGDRNLETGRSDAPPLPFALSISLSNKSGQNAEPWVWLAVIGLSYAAKAAGSRPSSTATIASTPRVRFTGTRL